MRHRGRHLAQRMLHRLEDLRVEALTIRPGDPLAERFAEFGAGSVFHAPRVHLGEPSCIAIGRNVTLRSYMCLETWAAPGTVVLRFGDRVHIGHSTRIVALNGIEIEENVGIGHNVAIGDSVHDPEEIRAGVPPAESRLVLGPPLRIGRNAYIGNGSLVAGGITIGEGAIIGPNSVVRRDIPPHTMVSGNPARVVPVAAPS